MFESICRKDYRARREASTRRWWGRDPPYFGRVGLPSEDSERAVLSVTMIVSADGSYRAMTADTASTEGKFYLQDGTLRYRSSRTIGTASLSEARGHRVLTRVPEKFVYGTGRAEYERVE